MATHMELPPAIRGALAYLDAVATSHQKRVATETDQGIGHDKEFNGRALRRAMEREVSRAFKLGGYVGYVSPLAQELEAYRLYSAKDSADALACAWCLMQRGGNPTAALTADYDFRGCGILHEEDINQLVADAKDKEDHHSIWGMIKSYHRKGDRVASYRYGGGCGHVILRGRRAVLDLEGIHWQMSEEGAAEIAKEFAAFEAAGGTKAFLAGTLAWPPPRPF